MVSAVYRGARRTAALNNPNPGMSSADPPTETARLFIAIPVAEPAKDAMEAMQSELRRPMENAVIRWSRREHFHLTLKFLGDVPVDQIEPLTRNVRKACEGFSALLLRGTGAGFFPNARAPRVIWAGIYDSRDILPKFQSAIAESVTESAPKERAGDFAGHVTLGRIKSIRPSEARILTQLAAGLADRALGEWMADRVEIIRSELSPAGAHYSVVSTILLPAEAGQGR